MGWIATWSARLSPCRRRARTMVQRYAERTHVPTESADVRMQRIGQWCVTGLTAAAELELFAWRRHKDCPASARVLLATLLARRGQTAMAMHVLPHRKHLHTRDDALTAQTLITTLTATGLTDTARQITHQLHHDLGHDTAVADWLRFMHMPGTDTLEPLSHSVVEQLACDLVGQIDVIPTLVAAQQTEPVAADIDLLRGAIGRVVRDIDDAQQNLMICEAMAQLALLASDGDDARRWAHRGLKLNPYAAKLALVLSQVPENETEGPRTVNVLQQVCNANPSYPDVHRALILRYRNDGDDDSARLQLRRWLDREPHNAIAKNLQQEIAA